MTMEAKGARRFPCSRLDDPQLRQRVLGAVEPDSTLIRDPLGAEAAPRFLVRRREKDEVSLERYPRALDGEHGGELEDAGRLHVDRAAAVDVPVLEKTTEGVYGPIALVGVDHVDVVVEHDASERPVALEARDEVAPPRRRLGGFARDAVAVEHLGEEARARRLVPGRVGGVDTEVAPQQLDRLVADL